MKNNEELQTKSSERDRVYACSNLCSEQSDSRVKISFEICLRCLSNNKSENLSDDQSAVEKCKNYK